MFFSPREGYDGGFELISHTEDSDVEFAGSVDRNSRCCVKIKGIAAHKLSTDYTITVQTKKGTITVTLSVLSYVKSAMNLYDDDAASLCAYSKAADAYRAMYPND